MPEQKLSRPHALYFPEPHVRPLVTFKGIQVRATMQSKRNFRAALPWLLTAALGGCTASIDGNAPGLASSAGAPAVPAGAGSAGVNTAGATQGGGGSAAMVPALPVWTGNVGSWCGPKDDATVWLVAKPQQSACEASSKKVFSDAATPPDTSEGLTLQLNVMQLATFPATLNVMGRYCGGVPATCSDVPVTLNVESYTQGQGAKGTWSFTPAGQAELKGRLEATWCSWDDFLPAHPDGERLARDIKISEVSVYQGVKVPIVRDMLAVPERNADLVQNREAMLRVFVEPAAGFQSRELSARLTLQNGTDAPKRFEQVLTVSAASTEKDGKSTFNLALPKDAFQEGTQYSVELRETSKCTPLVGSAVGARFPETGLSPVGARLTGPVKVMLVPVRYDADGSGRLPDLSDKQLTQMTERLYAMYPTSEVVFSMHEPVGTTRTDISDMLDQVRALRDAEQPPSDVAYYGMVRQAETFREYCQSSCTTGIAGFGSQNGTATAGMGIGYLDSAAGTFVHELGHIYRRPHAPCGGAAGTDEAYPYPEASLGSWGYDVKTKELFDPANHVDFMSYCSPEWISDYNYQLLLERIVVVNERATMQVLPPPGLPQVFRTVLVSDAGNARWGLELRPRTQPPGDPVTVEVLDQQGTVLTQVVAYHELVADGEQAYFVPAAHSGWHAVRVPGAAPLLYSEVTQNEPFTR